MQPAAESPSAGLKKILEAAEECFAEKGFDGTSIQEIARRAGVSKANIFHHFDSKESLYLTVLRRACEHLATTLDLLPEADPLSRMEAFVRSHLQALLTQPQPARLIQRALLEAGASRSRKLAEEVFANTFGKVVALVEAVRDQGRLRSDVDPALVAFWLIGANVFFFENRTVLHHLPGARFADDPDGYSRSVFRFLMEGVKCD